MIKGPELKEMLNKMSEEELSQFSATIITDKSVIDSIIMEAKYNLDFSAKDNRNDDSILDEVADKIDSKLIFDTVIESWYEAYSELDDPYGYNDAWDCFISDVDERVYTKIHNMIEEAINNNEQ